MEITLKEKQCLKYNLTLQEALIATAFLSGGYTFAITNMVNRGILNHDATILTPEWKKKIEALLNEMNSSPDISEERLSSLALKVQECFPKQKMVNNYGQESPYYFRCNRTEIKNKLQKFITLYGSVSDEDIIDATKRYVATFASKGYRGMRLAKYFIIKDDKKLTADDEIHVEQISDLATFLENKTEEKPDDIVNGDDWLLNSRN